MKTAQSTQSPQSPLGGSPEPVRRGVIAVVVENGRLLVIRRSQTVIAPGTYCFPGGGIESGETHAEALCREMVEELAVEVRPVRQIWHCVTTWNVELFWWQAVLLEGRPMVPDPREIASVHWMNPPDVAALDGLLESNRQFLADWSSGRVAVDGLSAP